VIGAPYADTDADGRRYRAMLRQPVPVFEADANGIRRAYARPLARKVELAIYTRELFAAATMRPIAPRWPARS
jgi:hypothetical protein